MACDCCLVCGNIPFVVMILKEAMITIKNQFPIYQSTKCPGRGHGQGGAWPGEGVALCV